VLVTGWGVAGCGWVARDHALPGLLDQPAARVVALHDPSPSAMARMTVDAPRYSSLEAFLAAPGLDAVYVATPNSAHRSVVEEAAAAGKAVLCEKPLAADLADAEHLVRACHGVLLGTAYNQRWHPAHVRLRELLPELGTVTAVRVVYCCWLPVGWTPDGRPHDNWRIDYGRAGGGAAIDLAPHGIDLVGVLLGEDIEVLHALLQSRVHDYSGCGAVDDGAMLHGRTRDGVLVDLHVAYNTPDALPRRRLEIIGTRGALVAVDTMGQQGGGSLTLLDPDPTPIAFGDSSPFAAQFAAFTAAVDGTTEWPYDAARDLRLHRMLMEALA
jgi:1,5-anhydro-D-fructose reductase (1,5-anhydro-D-mannitol-forming)